MGEWGVTPPLLISALDKGEWSASRPARFIIRGKEPSVPILLEAGRGSRRGLDAGENSPCRDLNADSSAVQPVAIPAEPTLLKIKR
jgi:hypothetical protein